MFNLNLRRVFKNTNAIHTATVKDIICALSNLPDDMD